MTTDNDAFRRVVSRRTMLRASVILPAAASFAPSLLVGCADALVVEPPPVFNFAVAQVVNAHFGGELEAAVIVADLWRRSAADGVADAGAANVTTRILAIDELQEAIDTMRADVGADLRAQRTQSVEGWFLSDTELALCDLARHRPSAE